MVGNDGVEHLAKLPKLLYLNLDNTRVDDEGLKHIATLPKLGTLTLNETSRDRRRPGASGIVRTLKKLELRLTPVTDEGVEQTERSTTEAGRVVRRVAIVHGCSFCGCRPPAISLEECTPIRFAANVFSSFDDEVCADDCATNRRCAPLAASAGCCNGPRRSPCYLFAAACWRNSRYCLAAEHTVIAAARAGALEATLPRATSQSVAESVMQRLAGYRSASRQTQLVIQQNGAPILGRFNVQPNDRISVTSQCRHCRAARLAATIEVLRGNSPIEGERRATMPGRKLERWHAFGPQPVSMFLAVELMPAPGRRRHATHRNSELHRRRVELGVVEHPQLDQLAEAFQVDVGQSLIVIAAEHFLVAHRALGGQLQHVVLAVRADDELQPAEEVAAPSAPRSTSSRLTAAPQPLSSTIVSSRKPGKLSASSRRQFSMCSVSASRYCECSRRHSSSLSALAAASLSCAARACLPRSWLVVVVRGSSCHCGNAAAKMPRRQGDAEITGDLAFLRSDGLLVSSASALSAIVVA